VSRQKAAIVSDFIINENLELLIIKYLAQKVYVLFLGHNMLVKELMARLGTALPLPHLLTGSYT